MNTVQAPSCTDPVVGGFSRLIGGPWGQRAYRPPGWFWTPVRVILVLAVVVLALGWVQKEPCRSPSSWVNQHQYTELCYSDIVALYYQEKLNVGQVPYADHAVQYPVLTGGLMAVAAWIAHLFPSREAPQRFFDFTALLLAICGLIVVWTTVQLSGRRRPWDAAMVALAPVLALEGFINWDLLAVALTGLGLLAWVRRRPALAGIALGLGVAAKLYPLLFLVIVLPALISWGGGWRRIGWRDQQWRRLWIAWAAGALAWLVVDLPIWLAYPSAFGRFYADNFHRVADWDSLLYALQYVVGRSGRPFGGTGFALASSLAVVVALAVAVALILRAPVAPRLGQAAFLVLLAFLLANKVWSPQYSLWLLPIVVLARPRWGPFLLWQASEVWLLFTRFYFFVGLVVPGQGVPEWVFLWSVLLRDASLILIAVLVVREMYHPELDPVRAADESGRNRVEPHRRAVSMAR